MGAWRVVHEPDSTHEGFDLLQLIRHSNLFKKRDTPNAVDPSARGRGRKNQHDCEGSKPKQHSWRSAAEAELGRLQERTEMFPICFHKKQ
jgi:hypothetical protein